jgi:hypothetical protein
MAVKQQAEAIFQASSHSFLRSAYV